MVEFREMTRSAPILERSLMSSSVTPSAKYSWPPPVGEKSANGKTAIERMAPELLGTAGFGHSTTPATASTNNAASATVIQRQRRREVLGGWAPTVPEIGRCRLMATSLPA